MGRDLADVPDAELMARVVRDDDRAAFGAVVTRNQAKVRGLLRKLAGGDHALADDLAQETFLRAYRRASTYSGTAKVSTWLCQIAYHAFLDGRARAKPTLIVGDPEDLATRPSDERGALLRHDVERALGRLDETERAALALTFGQDLTHEEAALILGCPLGTLKSTVARGMDKLEKTMRPWRGEP